MNFTDPRARRTLGGNARNSVVRWSSLFPSPSQDAPTQRALPNTPPSPESSRSTPPTLPSLPSPSPRFTPPNSPIPSPRSSPIEFTTSDFAPTPREAQLYFSARQYPAQLQHPQYPVQLQHPQYSQLQHDLLETLFCATNALRVQVESSLASEMHPTPHQSKRQRELRPKPPALVSKRSSAPSTTVSNSRSEHDGHHAPTFDSGCNREPASVGVTACAAPRDLEVLSVRVDATMAPCDFEPLAFPAAPTPNITSRKGMKYAKKPSPAEMKVATTLYLKRGLTMSQVAWLIDINLSTLATRIATLMKNGAHRVIPEDPMRMRVTNRIRRMRAATEDALFFSSTDKEASKRSLRKLLSLLSKVKHSIDICNWNISFSDLVKLVLAAKERGILVRVVADSAQAGQWFAKTQELKAANIPVHLLGTTNWCMHHKFCILDGVTLLNGSFNWSDRAATRNMESIIVTSNPKLVRLFKREFARIVRLDQNLAAFYAEQKKSKAEQQKKQKFSS